MSRRHLTILCSVLVLAGLVVTVYRWLVLDFPLLPQERASTWRVEVQISFEAKGAPVKAALMLPQNRIGMTLLDEHFISRGHGLSTESDSENRRGFFTKRNANGSQTLWYRFLVHQNLSREIAPKILAPRQVESSGLSGVELVAAQELAKELDSESADDRSLVRLLFSRLKNPQIGGKEALLLGGGVYSRSISRAGVAVLRVARIPSRVVNGLALRPDRRSARITSWIEIFDDDKWSPFNPETGRFLSPENHFPWWKGNEPLLSVVGAADPRTEIAVRETLVSSLETAIKEGRLKSDPLLTLSLFGLPLQTQEVYRLLMTVPVGIFLLVILRNVIGLRTFGTFMPVLIALAFRQTELLYGFILFSTVLGIGLMIRFYLEYLKLLLVPRLASVVVVVIIVMTFISIVSYKIGFDRGLSVALFPIVILAMTIERMTVVWDERGAKEAIVQATGSFAVAVLCYLLMTNELVKHWTFVFPELLLVILAAILALGRYSGYRLVELPRFKVLSRRD